MATGHVEGFGPLISVDRLRADPSLRVVDVRLYLDDAEKGRRSAPATDSE